MKLLNTRSPWCLSSRIPAPYLSIVEHKKLMISMNDCVLTGDVISPLLERLNAWNSFYIYMHLNYLFSQKVFQNDKQWASLLENGAYGKALINGVPLGGALRNGVPSGGSLYSHHVL